MPYSKHRSPFERVPFPWKVEPVGGTLPRDRDPWILHTVTWSISRGGPWKTKIVRGHPLDRVAAYVYAPNSLTIGAELNDCRSIPLADWCLLLAR